MKRIYSEDFTFPLFAYALAFCLCSFSTAQPLSADSNISVEHELTLEEEKLMGNLGSETITDSKAVSTDKRNNSQYTPVVGTAKLDSNAEKESETIGKKTDGNSISGSGSVPGADEFVNSVNSNSNKKDSDNIPSVWKPMLSLMAVLAIIVLVAWFVKKLFPGQVNSGLGDVIQIIGRFPIDGKNSLCLAKFGNEILLLGIGLDGIRLVDKVSDPDRIASLLGKVESSKLSSISKSFSSVFKNARGDYLDDNLEDEEIIEEFGDEDSIGAQKDDELAGLLKKVRGLSKMKQNKRDH